MGPFSPGSGEPFQSETVTLSGGPLDGLSIPRSTIERLGKGPQHIAARLVARDAPWADISDFGVDNALDWGALTFIPPPELVQLSYFCRAGAILFWDRNQKGGPRLCGIATQVNGLEDKARTRLLNGILKHQEFIELLAPNSVAIYRMAGAGGMFIASCGVPSGLRNIPKQR